MREEEDQEERGGGGPGRERERGEKRWTKRERDGQRYREKDIKLLLLDDRI